MVSGRMIARAIVQCLGPAAPGFIAQRSKQAHTACMYTVEQRRS